MPFPLILIPVGIALGCLVKELFSDESSTSSGSSSGSSDREYTGDDGESFIARVTQEQHESGVHINCSHK